MSILINKDTKVITQGITGKTGQFHTHWCREYANGKEAFVAGVHPKTAGQDFEGVPIYASVKEAKAETGATASVVYVPPAGAVDAIRESVAADLKLVIYCREGIAVREKQIVSHPIEAEKKKCRLLGPTCVRLMTPAYLKVGFTPGHNAHTPPIGVVSRSGTLTFE